MSEVIDRKIQVGGIKSQLTPPPKYKIILKDDFGTASLCNVTILNNVFSKHPVESIFLVKQAFRTGQAKICTVESKDLAETLAHRANEERMAHARHRPSVLTTKYEFMQV